ncbi:O-antigen ligase family protein [Nocardiaceae bacterium NPDC056970]
MLTVIAGVVALLVLLSLPVVPPHVVVITLVVTRSLCDFGISTGARITALSPIGFACSLMAIYAAALFFLRETNIPVGLRKYSMRIFVGSGAVVLWVTVATFHFGASNTLLTEGIRMLSVLSLFLLAVSGRADVDSSKAVMIMGMPAVVIGLIGAAGVLPGAVNAAGRMAGSFSHPNTAGAFFGIFVVQLAAMALARRDLRSIIMLAGALAALMLTGSLGGIVGATAGVLVVLWVQPRLGIGYRVVATGIGAVGLYAFYQVFDLASRLSEFDWGRSVSVMDKPDSFQWRVENWRRLIEISSDSPIFGFGLGASSHMIMPLGGPPHSIYVQTLVDMGLVGLAALVALIVVLLVKSIRLARRGRWEGAVLAGLVVFCAVNGVVSNLIGYTAAVYLLVVSAAFLVRSSRRSESGAVEFQELAVDRENPVVGVK